MANRLAPTVITCVPVLLVAALLPAPYRMLWPGSIVQNVQFFLSTALALAVVCSLAMLMYVLLFYTISQRGVRIIATAITSFLSGGVIPLPFFPDAVLRVVRVLPFAAIQNMPLQIFAGSIAGAQAWLGIAFQLGWLIALILLGNWLMGRALHKVVVQGG